MTERPRLDPIAAAMDCQLLADVLACVRRFRAQVRHDTQRVREIQHLRTAARLLFEDRPDKNRAVEAIKHISARHAVLLSADSRAWLEQAESAAAASPSDPAGNTGSATAGASGSSNDNEHDWGERLDWQVRVNHAGQFPYTQGADALGARTASSSAVPPSGATTAAASDPAMQLAVALRSIWRAANDVLRSATERSASAQEQAHAHAPSASIAFDEHRDAAHRALASAARRVWAVTMRDQFGATGDSMKLRFTGTTSAPSESADPVTERESDRLRNEVDAAEDTLLAALQILATPVELDDD
jgi:hypothetical protein